MIRTDVLTDRKNKKVEELIMKISQKSAKKWVSLMMPDERKLTNTTFINEAEKPLINQEQLQEFDRKLKKALMNRSDVEITYYVDESFQTIQSQVRSIDTVNGDIFLVHGDQTKMPITRIISIELKPNMTKETTTIYRGAM